MLAAAGMGALGLGLGAIGNIFGSSAAKKQEKMMREALEWQKQKFEESKKYTTDMDKRAYEDLNPYRQMGQEQVNAITDRLDNPAVNSYIDPGMEFRMKTGTNAINNAAAAKGMQLSGDTLRGLQEFGQDMGSQEYGNAFNRWAQDIGLRQGIAQQGQQAAVQSGELGNQNASILMGGSSNAAANVGNQAQATSQYVGAGDRMWGNYLGGLGGMAMGGAGSMMGGAGGGMMSKLSGMFSGGGMGSGASANQWFG